MMHDRRGVYYIDVWPVDFLKPLMNNNAAPTTSSLSCPLNADGPSSVCFLAITIVLFKCLVTFICLMQL